MVGSAGDEESGWWDIAESLDRIWFFGKRILTWDMNYGFPVNATEGSYFSFLFVSFFFYSMSSPNNEVPI